MPDAASLTPELDLSAHAERAVAAYLQVQGFYQDLAESIRRIVEETLRRHSISVHSVQGRAKDPRSFGKKASRPAEADPTKPKYADPLTEITDLAGVRIITYFPGTQLRVDELLREEFEIVESSDKGQVLLEEERFGYQSVHYLAKLRPNRSVLPEYERFSNAVTEIQLRTILQHAWAEIEHDIQYKAASVIPADIRRRFMALAGVLEIADREFQTIQDMDEERRTSARAKVHQGHFEEVEITPDAVSTYLDRRLGEDGRISSWSYNWTTRLLRRLGFTTIQQIDDAVRPYDDDRLSRIATGSRQGQTSRFEYMLLAALGDEFMKRHVFAAYAGFGTRESEWLRRFREAGIPVGTYDPLHRDSANAKAG
jgi:putative GTP pyrophosphokinase